MLTISLNSQDVERGLNQLLRNIQHRQPMMQGIAAELLSMTEDNFERESWGNEPWQPTHRGGKILQLSGQLAASIHTLATNQRAQIGSNKIYAAIHHIGGQRTLRPQNIRNHSRPTLPAYQRQRSIAIRRRHPHTGRGQRRTRPRGISSSPTNKKRTYFSPLFVSQCATLLQFGAVLDNSGNSH